MKELSLDYLAGRTPRRPDDAHKGTMGTLCSITGSYGFSGAAVLSAKAALRSGVGLLTVHVPECGYAIMQLGIPEAKCQTDKHSCHHTSIELPAGTEVVGIGPGIGLDKQTGWAMHKMMQEYPQTPMVFGCRHSIACQIVPMRLRKAMPCCCRRFFQKNRRDFLSKAVFCH